MLLNQHHSLICRKKHKNRSQSDGQVAWQWAYSAFGDEKPTVAKNRFANVELNQSFGSTTVPAVTFNLRYPGQYFDQESGLHYNYHRSYSATMGRYTQADPIGLDGGWNRFNYAELNPMGFTDPEGLEGLLGLTTFESAKRQSLERAVKQGALTRGLIFPAVGAGLSPPAIGLLVTSAPGSAILCKSAVQTLKDPCKNVVLAAALGHDICKNNPADDFLNDLLRKDEIRRGAELSGQRKIGNQKQY